MNSNSSISSEQLLQCSLSKQWSENPYFNYLSGNHYINSIADVAFIFQGLQAESNEHFFAVHVRENKTYDVQWISSGSNIATLVPVHQIAAGAVHFNAETTYLIHNHPSGNLTPSKSDVITTQRVIDILNLYDINVHHIIINLTSGKYGILDIDENHKEDNFLPSSEIPFPLKIHSFSKNVFHETYNPVIIKHNSDAAALISSYRFSTGDKVGALFLSTRNSVVASYLLPGLMNSDKHTAKELINKGAYHNSNGVILFGNLPITKELYNSFNNLEDILKSGDLKLFDYIQFSNSYGLVDMIELPDNSVFTYRSILEVQPANLPSKFSDPENIIYKSINESSISR